MPESGVGERGWSYLQTLLGCLWLRNFGKDLPITGRELLLTEIPCGVSMFIQQQHWPASGLALADTWTLKALINFVVTPDPLGSPSGYSAYPDHSSLAKKKGLLGRMPLGRLSLRKQHTLLFMVFSFSPIKSDFAFSHYLGERDKDLHLICKSCSSHLNCYYPNKKTSFSALKSFSYLLSLRGLHLPIFCY